METKKLDKFILLTVVVEVLALIIAPAVMAWYGRYVHYDPSALMAVSFVFYFSSGPIVNGIMGAMYAIKNKKPIIVLSAMIVGNLVLGFTLLDQMELMILFIPMLTFCLVYGVVYMACAIQNKQLKHN